MKIIIAITLSLFVFSCSMFKDSEPVEHLMIRTYLLDNEVHNYEPVLFSRPDSAFTSVKSEKEYQRLWGIASLNEVLEHQYKFTDSQQSKQYADSARKYQLKCDSMEKAFQPQFKGWKIHHIYKSDNEKKGRVVNHFIFYFDFKRDTLVWAEQVYRDLQVKSFEDNPDTYGFPRHIEPYINPK